MESNLASIFTKREKMQQIKASIFSKAFGLLKGKIKDPVEWQRAIREESNRDIYENKFSEFAGIWKDRDITHKCIREQAWR